jgi:hypothetical protein
MSECIVFVERDGLEVGVEDPDTTPRILIEKGGEHGNVLEAPDKYEFRFRASPGTDEVVLADIDAPIHLDNKLRNQCLFWDRKDGKGWVAEDATILM